MDEFNAGGSVYDGISDSDLMDKAQGYETGCNGLTKDVAKAKELYGVLAGRGNAFAKFKFEQLAKLQAVDNAKPVANSNLQQKPATSNQKKEGGGGFGALLGALAVAGAGYAAYKGVSNHNAAKERERLRKEQEERENAEMGKKVAGLALGALGNTIGGPVAGTLLGGLASLLTGDDGNGGKKKR